MDEQSVEPTRARTAPEDPIAEPPANQPGWAPQPAMPSYAPPPAWQQAVPVADLPRSPWQPPVADLPQTTWQPNAQIPMAPVATAQPLAQVWPAPEPWHPPLLVDAGLPPGWHAPLRTDLVPVVPRKRRGKRLVLIAAAVVVLLVAGVTTWLAWPPDRSPFEQAVANLAAQPVVNYRADLPDGSQWDGRATNQGDAIGWLTAASLKFPFLIANGKLYVQMDGTLFPPGIYSSFNQQQMRDRWVTGDLGDLAPLLKQEVTPSAIAGKLRDQVARTEKLPTPDDDGTTINNVPVLKADTPDGTLYVARNQPYRVVRWIDKNTRKATAAFANPGRKLQLNGARASYTGLGTVDFTPMNDDDFDKTYDDMETDAGKLGDAVDTSVQVTVDAIDEHSDLKTCVQTGCPITAHFTATPKAGASVPPQVTMQMRGNATVDDIDAGTCTTTAKMATSGSGTLSCVDNNMKAGFQQANDKAEANAKAKSGDSGYWAWTVYAEFHASVVPLAGVDPVAESKRLESLRPDHACGWTDQGGAGRKPLYLSGTFTARMDSARYPDFEIHVFRDGRDYGDFGPSGWFAKNDAAVPSDAPKDVTDQLSQGAIAFMKSAGTLKNGDSTDGDKWKRPAPRC